MIDTAETTRLIERRADVFTGTMPDYTPPPHYYEIEDLFGLAPPLLPGTDPDREPHYARGIAKGPLYLSKTILGTDPLWLRLAYVAFPVSARDLIAILSPFIPPQGSVRNLLPYVAEIEAVRLLRARENGGIGRTQEEAMAAKRFHAGTVAGDDVLRVWAMYQHLAISVVWAWGVRKERQPNQLYFYTLADEVARIYHDTQETRLRRLAPPPNGDMLSDPGPFPLERIKAGYRKSSASQWEHWEGPDSLARVAQGLFDAVGAAGTTLEECPNCARVFQKHDARQAYCSPYCRNIFHRKRTRAEGEAGTQDFEEAE